MRSTLVRLLVTVGLTVALVYWLDIRALLASAAEIRLSSLALGIALCFVFVAARIYKWVMILRANSLRAHPLDITRAVLFALAVGIVTPVRIGEVVAVIPFPPDETRSRALMVYLFDRIGELSTVLLFSSPACYLLLPYLGKPVATGLVIASFSMPIILQIRSWRSWIAMRFAAHLSSNINLFLTSEIRASTSYWLWSCFTYLVTYASIAAFIHGFEPIHGLGPLMILPVVTISNLVTVTIGGISVREGLAALLAPAVGMTPEHVAASFFLSFVFTRVLPGLAGLMWYFLPSRGPKT